MRMNEKQRLFLLGALIFGATAPGVHADVKLPAVFSDHMVLQQGISVPIWGDAAPGEEVTVSILDQTKKTVASFEGKWMVKLNPLTVNEGTVLQVSGINTIALSNVAVGEVWLASGQSNMEWTLSNTHDLDNALTEANDPLLRLFKVEKGTADRPLSDVKGSWKLSTPEIAKPFSAVGWYFGRELRKRLNVPVGVIHSSWGGTPAEAWTSGPALQADAEFGPIIERWNKYLADYPTANERYKNEVLPRWEEERKRAREEGRKEPERPREPLGPNSPHRPANLFNAMIAPIVPYGVKGAIWYQGESNAPRAYQYRRLLPAMIQDWRASWGIQNPRDFAFYIVQLANFRAEKPEPGESDWAELREAQTMTALMPGNGQALAIDIGEANDIHPRNKRDVGIRLAVTALAQTYGLNIESSGPMFAAMTREGNRLRLKFSHADGLVSNATPIPGFAIAGPDQKWKWGNAKIEGDEVIVWNDQIADPIAVRYAWADNPRVTLYNAAGLPAVPFRTDIWPGMTFNAK
jgi:sialate O-acetylesterase